MRRQEPVTLLLVEDDVALRADLAEWLEEQEYTVATAGNGQEALEHVRREGSPDLILLDLMMPVMSGWEFLVRRKDEPALARTPVVILSAACNCEGISDFGIMACFKKPLDLESLLDVIADTCRQR